MWRLPNQNQKKTKTTVTHHRRISTRGPLPQRPLHPGLWNVWREFRTGGAPRVAEVLPLGERGGCSTFNKTQPLGYWTKKPGLCSHRANGPSHGWTSGEEGAGAGDEAKSSVRDVFVHWCSSVGNVLAGAGALRGNKGMNIECLECWPPRCLVSRKQRYSPFFFKRKNCLLIYRSTVSWPWEAFALIKDGQGLCATGLQL